MVRWKLVWGLDDLTWLPTGCSMLVVHVFLNNRPLLTRTDIMYVYYVAEHCSRCCKGVPSLVPSQTHSHIFSACHSKWEDLVSKSAPSGSLLTVLSIPSTLQSLFLDTFLADYSQTVLAFQLGSGWPDLCTTHVYFLTLQHQVPWYWVCLLSTSHFVLLKHSLSDNYGLLRV